MTGPTEPTVPPMSAERRARLVALSQLHSQWWRQAADRAAFEPTGKVVSDYNLHNIDVNPDAADDDAFHQAARKIFGLPDQAA